MHLTKFKFMYLLNSCLKLVAAVDDSLDLSAVKFEIEFALSFQ